MNREVTFKKVKGRGRIYTSLCPVDFGNTQIMIGSPACLRCQYFVKVMNKEGKVLIHCKKI